MTLDQCHKCVMVAMSHNQPAMAEHLLKTYEIDGSINNNALLMWATERGHVAIVKLLIGNVTSHQTLFLYHAAVYGHIEIVRLLCATNKMDVGYDNGKLLVCAIACNRHTVVNFLLETAPQLNFRMNRDEPIRTAVAEGHGAMVRLLLAWYPCGGKTLAGELLRQAVRKGHVGIVKQLLAIQTMSESEYISLVSTAVLEGHHKIVWLLYEMDCWCQKKEVQELVFLHAVRTGQAHVIRLFVEKQIEMPHKEMYIALNTAIKGNHVETVRLLLAMPTTLDTYKLTTRCIENAVHQNQASMVQILLTNPKVDLVVDMNGMFFCALFHNHLAVMWQLLKTGNINLSNDGARKALVRSITAQGHTGILKTLLDQYGADPAANDGEALCVAVGTGQYDTVELLLETQQVDVTCRDHLPMRLARLKKYTSIEALLLKTLGVNPYE